MAKQNNKDKKSVPPSLMPKSSIKKKAIPIAQDTPKEEPKIELVPEKKEEKKSKRETHRYTLRLRKDVYKTAAIHCVQQETSMTAYIEGLIMKDLKIK